MAELSPCPFGGLVTHMFRELDRHGSIFHLPAARFFLGDPALDFSVRCHGALAASPLGPAAGPHSQMAQNIVLSWLGGARIIELKTVQTDDELDIPRPCIDMRTVGLNTEWSQELKLEQSLEEYVKGSMLVEILRASGRLPLAPGFDRVVYDLSVGYDLAGIRSERVQGFVRGLVDARPVVERLRAQIPAAFKRFRALDFAPRIAGSVTLSTFHGCPPAEIESIVDFLLRELRLECTVKFNPTLLGATEALDLLHEQLGYREIHVPAGAFERDPRWEQAVALMERLGESAARLGLGLGAKFSNTLVVANDARFLPASAPEAYLSGPPLHVLAMQLVSRFRRRFGDRFPVSFAAGIHRANFPDAVALGLVPITVCTDLLKTGGYGRLAAYHRELGRRMTAAGATSVGDFILRAHGQGEAALETLGLGPDAPARAAAERALAGGTELRAAVDGDLYARWVSAAKLLNTEVYVGRVARDPRYAAARNRRPPVKVGRRLELFDCLTCDKCVPVCPNDANFTFVTPRAEIPVVKVRRDGARWTFARGESIILEEKHQIANFADFCNECGNCDVFCPEDGGPHVIKPRFFGSASSWRRFASHDGFYLERHPHGDRVLGRFGHRAFRLDRAGARVSFSGDGFALRFDAGAPEATLEGEAAVEVDLTCYYIMDLLREALLDGDQANLVSTLALAASGGDGP